MSAPTKTHWSCRVNDRAMTLVLRRDEWYEKSGRLKNSEEQIFTLDAVRDQLWDSGKATP